MRLFTNGVKHARLGLTFIVVFVVRLHRMHKMQTIAIDVSGVCQSDSQSTLRSFAVQTRLNGSSSGLEWRLLKT